MNPIDQLWPPFIERHWNRGPAVLRGWPAHGLASRVDIVQGLARIGGKQHRGRLSTRFHVRMGDRSVERDPESWLPQRGELGPEYARRVGARAGDGVIVAAEDFQLHSPDVASAVRRFTAGLMARTGSTTHHARILACFGNYLEMPYGMHPARAHNFLVVVAGRTSVRVWPPATFKTNSVTWLHRTDYKSIVGRSRLLEGRPGDILYWPAGSWHVNEGYTRTMSVGLNILLFPE